MSDSPADSRSVLLERRGHVALVTKARPGLEGPVSRVPTAAGPPTAIVGLGLTELGKVYGPSPGEFAAHAVRLAATDAGLALADVDGLLVSGGMMGGVTPELQRTLGLRDLGMLAQIEAFGSTAIGMVQYASMAIRTGLALEIMRGAAEPVYAFRLTG